MTQRIKHILLLCLTSILIVGGATACGDDKDEPETKPGIDMNLVGTWYLKLILESNTSETTLTFNEDGTFSIKEKAVLEEEQEPVEFSVTGTWKAEKNTLTLSVTHSTIPDIEEGKEVEVEYEVILNQLYIKDLFLFPFDKVN